MSHDWCHMIDVTWFLWHDQNSLHWQNKITRIFELLNFRNSPYHFPITSISQRKLFRFKWNVKFCQMNSFIRPHENDFIENLVIKRAIFMWSYKTHVYKLGWVVRMVVDSILPRAMRKEGQMTIGKTHPSLVAKLWFFRNRNLFYNLPLKCHFSLWNSVLNKNVF